MKHYKIFKQENKNGKEVFIVKKRFLFFFWFTCTYIDIDYTYGMIPRSGEPKPYEFKTEQKAIDAIYKWRKPKFKHKSEFVKEVIIE